MRFNDNFNNNTNADMCMQAYQAINLHLSSAFMLQLQPVCTNARPPVKGMYTGKAHMLKGMCQEKAHYMLKAMYKGEEEEEVEREEESHQTSVPTILSTAVKAVRGAVVALGVCIHNTALGTEGTTDFMTPTGECECECDREYCCWVLQVSSLNAALWLQTGSIFPPPPPPRKENWC